MTLAKPSLRSEGITALVDEALAPVLTSLVPDTAALGLPSFTLRVRGTGFRDGDAILWNGGKEPTTFVSDTELTTGVNMETASVAVPIPIAVETATGAVSNVLTFTLTAEPALPDVPLPDGWVRLADAWARPLLVLATEVVGVEERISHTDPSGPLYAQGPKGPYRRLTLRGGAQFYISSPGSVAVLAAVGG